MHLAQFAQVVEQRACAMDLTKWYVGWSPDSDKNIFTPNNQTIEIT